MPTELELDEITSLPITNRSNCTGTEEGSGQPGWDMEYYLNLDTDSVDEIGETASPYRRSTKQLKEMSEEALDQ